MSNGAEVWPVLDFDQLALTSNADLYADWLRAERGGGPLEGAEREEWEKVRDGLIAQAMEFPRTFTLRDFHAENLLWLGNGELGLLDFQDAVRGWDAWDMAMLTQDARRAVSPEAAEAAIRSPLLEDVDLNGARGILVNVTAGLDLSIGEFTEVGSCVEEFASPDATVVVGTVIDQTLQDEIKVTVVATGLGKSSTPNVVVDNTAVAPAAAGPMDYATLDAPTYARQTPAEKPTQNLDVGQTKDMEYLDIPAFLRRQAD